MESKDIEDLDLTADEVNNFTDAFKTDEFRSLLKEYMNEISNPANHQFVEEQIKQSEKLRGNEVFFMKPKQEFMIETSSINNLAFINVTTCAVVDEYTLEKSETPSDTKIKIPFYLSRIQKDNENIIYTAVFHPKTIEYAKNNNSMFEKILISNLLLHVEYEFNVNINIKDYKISRNTHKGTLQPSIIRHSSSNKLATQFKEIILYSVEQNREFYVSPSYKLKYVNEVDLKNCTYNIFCKLDVTVPKYVCIEINLPLLESISHTTIDILPKNVIVHNDDEFRYKLNLPLSYEVVEEGSTAKFHCDKHTLELKLLVNEKAYDKGLLTMSSDNLLFSTKSNNSITLVEDRSIQSNNAEEVINAINETTQIQNRPESILNIEYENKALNVSVSNKLPKRPLITEIIDNEDAHQVDLLSETCNFNNNDNSEPTEHSENHLDNRSIFNICPNNFETASWLIAPNTKKTLVFPISESEDKDIIDKDHTQIHATDIANNESGEVVKNHIYQPEQIRSKIPPAVEKTKACANSVKSTNTIEVLDSEIYNISEADEYSTDNCPESVLSTEKNGIVDEHAHTVSILKDQLYNFPNYYCNYLGNKLAFILEANNIKKESINHELISRGYGLLVIFSSVGSGGFPMLYSFCVLFSKIIIDENIPIDIITEEEKLFVHISLTSDEIPHEYKVGTNLDSLKPAFFNQLEALEFKFKNEVKHHQDLNVELKITKAEVDEVVIDAVVTNNSKDDNSLSITEPTSHITRTQKKKNDNKKTSFQMSKKNSKIKSDKEVKMKNMNKSVLEDDCILSESELLFRESNERHALSDSHLSWIIESDKKSTTCSKPRENGLDVSRQSQSVDIPCYGSLPTGRGILKKSRSYSESSGDELMYNVECRSSSVDDYSYSSDSFSHTKKTVTFNDVISKKLYRRIAIWYPDDEHLVFEKRVARLYLRIDSNISILEQQKRARRHSKKRERRSSESDTSEAESSDVINQKREMIQMLNERLSESEQSTQSEGGESSDSDCDGKPKHEQIACSKRNHKRKGKKSGRKNAAMAKHQFVDGD